MYTLTVTPKFISSFTIANVLLEQMQYLHNIL